MRPYNLRPGSIADRAALYLRRVGGRIKTSELAYAIGEQPENMKLCLIGALRHGVVTSHKVAGDRSLYWSAGDMLPLSKPPDPDSADDDVGFKPRPAPKGRPAGVPNSIFDVENVVGMSR